MGAQGRGPTVRTVVSEWPTSKSQRRSTMTRLMDAPPIRDIAVEAVLPNSPETVWRVLTTAELIGRWLMPNDFEPVVGKRFEMRTKPMGNWDGVVSCEVLEIVPNRKLVYSWKGGSTANPAYGSRLDTIVTWTLTPVQGGTCLRLVHAGFRSPDNDFAFDAMSPGWSRIPQRIGELAAEVTAR
jgi:uncharacterized protein YndB with AHSA1/START domain